MIEKNISNVIMNQFPDFYKEEGQEFMQFVKAYYEWLESENQALYHSRRFLEYNDIDDTADAFVDHFVKKYMFDMPKKLLGDKRFLLKHILDVYRSKGSIEGLKLLFILLYNEDIEVYIPSYDIIKASHGNWIEPKFLEVDYCQCNALYQGKMIQGSTSGATAIVDSYESKLVENRPIYIFYISSILGTFNADELLFADGIDKGMSTRVIGSITDISVTHSSLNFSGGDIIETVNHSSGEGLRAVVTGVKALKGIIEYTINDGGSGYRVGLAANITTGSNTTGSGAAAEVGSISNTSIYPISDLLLTDYQNVDLGDTNYANNGSDTSTMSTSNSSTNLDISQSWSNVTVGTISSIKVINPGTDYNGPVNVEFLQPETSVNSEPSWISGYGRNANVTTIAAFGDGIIESVRVIDTGKGFFKNEETITMYSSANSDNTANVVLNVGGLGYETGYWKDTESFLNSNKYIHDSHYYQEYSYEIQSSKTLDKFKNILKRVYHPVGNEMFGKPLIKNVVQDNISIVSSSITST